MAEFPLSVIIGGQLVGNQSIRDMPLNCLVMSEAQARVRKVDMGIEELATSIKLHGLLEPIVVCPAEYLRADTKSLWARGEYWHISS